MPAVSEFFPLIRRVWRRLAPTVVIILLSACTTVDIINLSELNARVLIQLPDSAGGTSRAIPSAGSTSTFSTHGGTVTIQTLPDEAYRQLLESLRDQITQRLFEERGTLSPADVARLVQNLNDIDKAVEDLADDEASCTVNAPDFSAVSAVLNWDGAAGRWSLSCSVASDE